MKLLIVIVLGLVAVVASFGTWYAWDSRRNRGIEFGYYGDFNRVSNALASISGVVITQAWHNHDLTLEEFGFSLTAGGQPVRLLFSETDPIRNWRREKSRR